MKKFEIAQDAGQVGFGENLLRAQINLGLKKGYHGFVQEKKEVLNFLTDLYKKCIVDGTSFVPFVVQDTVITYAYQTDDGPVGAHEPALLLTSDKSPLYASDMSEEEWKELIESYAKKLADRFNQFRVYVTYTRVEVKIFQQV